MRAHSRSQAGKFELAGERERSRWLAAHAAAPRAASSSMTRWVCTVQNACAWEAGSGVCRRHGAWVGPGEARGAGGKPQLRGTGAGPQCRRDAHARRSVSSAADRGTTCTGDQVGRARRVGPHVSRSQSSICGEPTCPLMFVPTCRCDESIAPYCPLSEFISKKNPSCYRAKT